VLDLFGKKIVLLDFAGFAAPLVEAADHRSVPLDHVEIDDQAIAAAYERKLVLVRPDGHVAWRGDAPPEDAWAVIDAVRGA